jgi:multiple sugar transport system substrate-binding protein
MNRKAMESLSLATTRRSLLQKSALLGAGAAGLTALGGQMTVPAAAQDSVDISMMGWGSPLEQENVENGLTVFQEANSNISVEWIHVPDEYDTKLKTAIAGGNAPDVFWATNLQDFVAIGAVKDISTELAADPILGAPDYFLEPQETERATVNGKWFGIGSCWVAPHIYYNTDLLAAAGVEPPSTDPTLAWTWDQFLEAGRLLTNDSEGRHPGDEGFDIDNVTQWGVSWPTFFIALAAAIYSNGGYTYGTDYTSGWGMPESIEAIQRVADLQLVQQIAPVPAAFEQMGMDAWTALATGNVAIIIDGSWALQDIAKLDFAFGAGVLPVLQEPATVMLAHCHVISSDTDQPEAAWSLLQYLSSNEYQLGLCQAGLWLPSHTSLLTEEGLGEWLTPDVHPEGYGQIASDYVYEYGHTLFYPAGYTEADQMLVAALDPVWIGDQTAQEALIDSGVADEVSALLLEKQELIAAV